MLCVLQAVVHCVQLFMHEWKLGEIGLGDHMIIRILLPRKVIAGKHSLAFSSLRARYFPQGFEESEHCTRIIPGGRNTTSNEW